jgi:hypothetical protein
MSAKSEVAGVKDACGADLSDLTGVTAEAESPVLIMMLGRGRVGKTATATALVQFYRSLGCDLKVWNADQQNESHSLSRFHADVEEPRPGSSFEDRKLWLEQRIQDQSRHGYDAVIDFAGGDPTVQKLAKEVRLGRMLARMGIRPVAVHVVGPEKADLDYLRQISETGLFMPEATIIVLNGGLVQSGRSVEYAFEDVKREKVVLDARKRGAEIVTMPALPCMSAIMDCGLSFADVGDGRFKPGQEPLSMFDQERTGLWLEQELPDFFGGLPRSWMPGSRRRG